MVAEAKYFDLIPIGTPSEDDRNERLHRYALRDKSLERIVSEYLADQLIRQPSFLRIFERALYETDGRTIGKLLFNDGSEWRCRRAISDRQEKALKLAEHEILGLDEALEQLMPKLRRGKLPVVARAHATALLRATTGRLRSKPAPPDTDP
jgi:hypothetical protein